MVISHSMRIKKGDNVIVTTGKDKGTQGVVERVLPREGRVVIQGVNKKKIHQKGKKSSEKGQIIEQAAPIDASNVQIVDPKSGNATRVRVEERDGAKVRVAVKSGQTI